MGNQDFQVELKCLFQTRSRGRQSGSENGRVQVSSHSQDSGRGSGLKRKIINNDLSSAQHQDDDFSSSSQQYQLSDDIRSSQSRKNNPRSRTRPSSYSDANSLETLYSAPPAQDDDR